MTISELIAELEKMAQTLGSEAEVLAQTTGCCSHGHDINSAEVGGAVWDDERGKVVLRCG